MGKGRQHNTRYNQRYNTTALQIMLTAWRCTLSMSSILPKLGVLVLLGTVPNNY